MSLSLPQHHPLDGYSGRSIPSHPSDTVYSIIAILALALAGSLYMQTFVFPQLSGEQDYYAYGGDNFTYRDIAEGNKFDEYLEIKEGKYLVNQINLFGISLWAKLAYEISEDHFEWTVYWLNIALLAVALRNFQIVFRVYTGNPYPVFLALLVLNPLVVAYSASLSKEVFGILIVSAFLRYRLQRAYVRYWLTTILSFFFRDAFAVIGVLFFVMSLLPVRRFYYLILLSVFVPFVIPEGMVALLLEGQDDKSMGIAVLLNDIQSVPFGYVIVFIPKLLLSGFADISPLRLYKGWDNVVGNSATVSGALSLICALAVLHNWLAGKGKPDKLVSDLFMAYAMIGSVTPFIHHRYLFPIYPILVMLAIGFATRPGREAAASNRRGV